MSITKYLVRTEYVACRYLGRPRARVGAGFGGIESTQAPRRGLCIVGGFVGMSERLVRHPGVGCAASLAQQSPDSRKFRYLTSEVVPHISRAATTVGLFSTSGPTSGGKQRINKELLRGTCFR